MDIETTGWTLLSHGANTCMVYFTTTFSNIDNSGTLLLTFKIKQYNAKVLWLCKDVAGSFVQ